MSVIYPVYFMGNICPHCGVVDKLKFIDNRGESVSHMAIYPITKIKCTECNTEYFPKWINNEEDPKKMTVTTTGNYAIDNMVDKISEYSLKNKRLIV